MGAGFCRLYNRVPVIKWIACLPVFLLVSKLAQPAQAAVVVTNCTETALDAALVMGGTITFACGGEITFTQTKTIYRDTVLDGGTDSITLSGDNQVRLFTVEAGVRFTLRNVRLQAGMVQGADGADGDADDPDGVPGNPAVGGALLNRGGHVTLKDCVVLNNTARGGNGGSGFTFPTCSEPGAGADAAGAKGGAICQRWGTLLISHSTFHNNSAEGGNGGKGGDGGSCGTGVDGRSGGSAGNGSGGSIYVEAGVVGITNCTFYENKAEGGTGGDGGTGSGGLGAGGDGGDGGTGSGGGIFNLGGSVSTLNTTFAECTARAGAGGAKGAGPIEGDSGSPGSWSGECLYNQGGSILLENTIVAGAQQAKNCGGTILDGGYNLSSDRSCGFWMLSLNDVDPLLESLEDGAGPTPTVALKPGSPAINRGNHASAPTTDQRYFFRTNTADIGSYEFGSGRLEVSVSLLATNLVEGADGGGFRISRTGPTSRPLPVFFSFAGSAEMNGDYWLTVGGEPFLGTSIVLSQGQSFVDIAVVLEDDTEAEATESIILELHPDLYYLGSSPEASLAILDNDSEVALSALVDTLVEGGSNRVFRIARVGATNSPLEVHLYWLGTAVPAEDYLGTSLTNETVTIPAGVSFVDLVIEPVDDEAIEETESVELELRAGDYRLGATTQATLLIIDNDSLVTVQALAGTLVEGGPEGVFRVTREGATNSALDVRISWLGSAALGSDYTVSSALFSNTTVTLPAREVSVDVAVTPLDDRTVEANESVVLQLEPGAYRLGTPSSASLVILDNDLVLISVDFRVNEGFLCVTANTDPDREYTIEFSSHFTNWQTLTNFTGTGLPVIIRDHLATNSPARFYRALASPVSPDASRSE